MSHYSVLVAIPHAVMDANTDETNGIDLESILDRILAPYEESPKDGAFMEFEDRTEDCREKYQEDTSDFAQFPDGSIHSIYSGKFLSKFVVQDGKIYSKPEKFLDPPVETGESKSIIYLPDQPVKEHCSFEEYCSDFCGYEQKNGRWGYRRNPNAKWDWWTIGGRWSGSMLARCDLECALYSTQQPEDLQSLGEYRPVDGAYKKDIAFSKMIEQETRSAADLFFKLEQAFAENNTRDLGPMNVIKEDGIYNWGELAYKAGESLDDYLQRKGLDTDSTGGFYPYAIVDKDGSWHGEGDMGWWGISTNEMPRNDWNAIVQKFIQSLEPEDYLVCIDCHI